LYCERGQKLGQVAERVLAVTILGYIQNLNGSEWETYFEHNGWTEWSPELPSMITRFVIL